MTFHPFPRLPCELRSNIWSLAIAQERTDAVYIRQRLYAIADLYMYSGNPADQLEYAMIPWPTSQTCVEARDEARRRGFSLSTRVGSMSSISIKWNDVELFCPQRYAYALAQACWTEDVRKVSLVNIVHTYFRDIMNSAKALMHGLQRVEQITIRGPVATYELDEVTCYPAHWFTAMNALAQEPESSWLRRARPHFMLAPQGVRVEEWLTSENYMFKWYFRPEDVAQIDGKIGQAWWEEFAKLVYCPASVNGAPGLMKLINATIGLDMGSVRLAQGVEVLA